MAIDQGGTGNSTKYYTVPDDAKWTFPDSDWFLCIWTRTNDNSGTGFGYLFSQNTFVATNSINVSLRENSASNAKKLQVNTANLNLLTPAYIPDDGKDRLFIIQRVGGNLEINFCEKGQAATLEVSATYTDGEINGTGLVNIGRRQDASSIRYWHDTYGDIYKGSGSLTLDQMTLLGQGVDPIAVIGYDNFDLWFQFREATATVTDVISGLVATRGGAPDTVEHFPVVAPLNAVIPTVSSGLNLSPTGIASAESFGSPTITTGSVDLALTGIASQESFGSPTVAPSQALTATGIVSEESLGLPTVTTGAVDLTLSGIASEESIGSPVLTTGALGLSLTGVASEESIGSPTITTGAVDLATTGIGSTESFGSPTVVVATNVALTLTGIASLEAFGSPIVSLEGDKIIKIDGLGEKILNTNLASTTLYYNGKDYFTI